MNNLAVTVGNFDGAAGHLYVELLFTNTSTRTCTLTGFPGVSYLDATGKQVGPAAVRDNSIGRVIPVRLSPAGTGYAELALPNVSMFGTPGTPPCKSIQATSIRVYPPGSFAATTVAYPLSVCTGSVGSTQVRPVLAGRMS